MQFVPREHEEILSELQGWSNTPESKVEGTFEFDCFSTNGLEFMKVENELAEAYRANFGQTTWGEYLDMRAAEHGVYRREAKKAVGELTITGNGTINLGAIFATEAGTRFVATSTTAIKDIGTIEIEAVKAGDVGNVAANTITQIPLSIPGIESCTNEAATYDGYDAEDDDTLRQRFLDKVRLPATSGNPNEYVAWAMSIVGVGAARCIRTPYGAGTVKVVIVDSNFEEANADLLERVQTYIDSQRPVGIVDGNVYVVSARPLVINIEADITGAIDESAFRAGLIEYFSRLIKRNFGNYQAANDGILISAAQIGRVILNAGAETYVTETLKINGQQNDIHLDVEELPMIGTIKFT